MLYHKHLLVNAKITKPLQNENEGSEFLRNLVNKIDMKILQGPFATYLDVPNNRGLTAIVLIETSHIAFHIWDESDPALLQFDLYTCGPLKHRDVLDVINEQFEPTFLEYVLFDRQNGFVVEDKSAEWPAAMFTNM